MLAFKQRSTASSLYIIYSLAAYKALNLFRKLQFWVNYWLSFVLQYRRLTFVEIPFSILQHLAWEMKKVRFALTSNISI